MCMKRLISLLALVGCMTVAAPVSAQNQVQIENPRRAVGLDTVKQIRPTDLRESADKKPGTLFCYKGKYYVAENSEALRKLKITPQDPKAVMSIYVVLESLIAEYQSKLPAKHRAIQTVVLIEDWK